MSQVTIYMDDDTEHRVRGAAAAAGVSVSRWIADLVRARTAATWPADVVQLAGAWGASEDDPRAGLHTGDDLPREPL
ncbi:hypothetical protein LBMAG42_23560 [Deltaproteobacteria bacterium]|nr:hypothetical protein LBMAG42_23560 [Deltaproteobacteria bacterium]